MFPRQNPDAQNGRRRVRAVLRAWRLEKPCERSHSKTYLKKPMKHTPCFRFLAILLLLGALAVSASAQTTVPVPGDNVRRAGERELTLGGSGAVNKDFNDSLGGVSGSFGQYLNETQEVVL